MKRLALVFICFCFVGYAGVSIAKDVKPVPKLTQEQVLTIEIEKLQNTVDYAKSQMTALESLYRTFSTVHQKATKDLQALQMERVKLKASESKKKKR